MKNRIQMERGENLKRIERKIKKHRKDEYLPSGEEVGIVKEVKGILRETLHLQKPQYHWNYKYGGYFRDISGNKPTELTIYDTGRKIKLTILVEYRRLAAIRTESEEIAVMSEEERCRNQEGWGMIQRGCWRNKRKKQEERQRRREEEARMRRREEMEKGWEAIWGELKGSKEPRNLQGFAEEQEEPWDPTYEILCMGYAYEDEYDEEY